MFDTNLASLPKNQVKKPCLHFHIFVNLDREKTKFKDKYNLLL